MLLYGFIDEMLSFTAGLLDPIVWRLLSRKNVFGKYTFQSDCSFNVSSTFRLIISVLYCLDPIIDPPPLVCFVMIMVAEE